MQLQKTFKMSRTKYSTPLLLFSLLLLLISACTTLLTDSPTTLQPEIANTFASSTTQTPTPLSTTAVNPTIIHTPSSTTTSIPSSTVTPIPSRTITPFPTETPSPTPLPSCPELGQPSLFSMPSDTVKLQTSILAFLNAGGQWSDLLALLTELEINHDSIQTDMNGDGIVETIVYAMLFDSTFTPDHAWWVLQCTTNQYEVIHTIRGNWVFHRYFTADDLNNDSHPEIIEVGGFAGSACDLEPWVWSWQNDRIIDWSPDYLELDLGCSLDDKVILEDIDGDEIKEMILIGQTVFHPSYAPLRGITQTFALQETGYKLISTVFAPPTLRIHLLDAAQRALDAGDLSLATFYYTQAAYAEMVTVESYNLSYPHVEGYLPIPTAYQRGFALFRLFVIKMTKESEVEAQTILGELNGLYQEGMPGYEFVVLAQTFFDVFKENGSLALSCLEITKYISEHYAGDEQSGQPALTSHFYWGANVASYPTPHSICPFHLP